jgi:hypothetical protein
MTDPTDFDPRSAGEKGMDAATGAVHAAAEQVDRVGRHLKRKIEAAKQPQTYLTMLAGVTKAAPLGMLAVAFVGGMLFARRR